MKGKLGEVTSVINRVNADSQAHRANQLSDHVYQSEFSQRNKTSRKLYIGLAKKVCLVFTIRCYGKTQMNFLVNPVYVCCQKVTCHYGPCESSQEFARQVVRKLGQNCHSQVEATVHRKNSFFMELSVLILRPCYCLNQAHPDYLK